MPVSVGEPRNWRHSFAGDEGGAAACCAPAIGASRTRSAALTKLFVREREQLAAIVDEEDAIGRYHRRVDGAPHVHLSEHFLLFARGHDNDVAVFIAEIDLAVDDEGRGPDGGKHVVRPVLLTGLLVETVQVPAEIRDEDET